MPVFLPDGPEPPHLRQEAEVPELPDVVRQSQGAHPVRRSPDGRQVRQSQDVHQVHRIQGDRRGRQGLPVRLGRCASGASGGVRPEAAEDGCPEARQRQDEDARRSGGCAAELPEQVPVPCRSGAARSAA